MFDDLDRLASAWRLLQFWLNTAIPDYVAAIRSYRARIGAATPPPGGVRIGPGPRPS